MGGSRGRCRGGSMKGPGVGPEASPRVEPAVGLGVGPPGKVHWVQGTDPWGSIWTQFFSFLQTSFLVEWTSLK